MPRVTCRCGERLSVEPNGPERINCPKCGAKIRLRRAERGLPGGADNDGFLRFLCPCGRRLKVPAVDRPVAGKCPNCGRVVPVPTSGQANASAVSLKQASHGDAEARTEELDASDLAQLQEWGLRYPGNPNRPETPVSTSTDIHTIGTGAEVNAEYAFISPTSPPASAVKFEAGLRVCPRCKKPIHLGAAACRECGTPVPRH